jgi:NDP-sugar pyrophosphorylase family protein
MPLSSNKKVRAVILAGGKGTRLRPLTVVFPKPLVPLGDKPIVEILLSQLQSFGLKDVTICTGYLSELIMTLCGDGSKFGLNITYSKEDSPLGTAGPLGNLDDLTDPIIVMNGDLLTNLNFNKMIDYHLQQQADMTIGVYKREVKIDFGVVESNQAKEFTGFKEKPIFNFEVSMGINVISSAALKYVNAGQYLDMPDLILKIHNNGGKVSCYRENCFWLDIGRMDDYAQAQEQYSANMDMFQGSIK